jgi:hypothetical protein
VVAEVIPFPYKKCKVCGFAIVPKKDEPEYDKCFCCRKGIPLPLSNPKDAK